MLKIETKQEIFDKFMNEFVKLDYKTKNVEIFDKLKNILIQLINIAKEKNIEYDILKSKEINDILSYKATNEDYQEAIMVYVENIEEMIGLILLNIL